MFKIIIKKWGKLKLKFPKKVNFFFKNIFLLIDFFSFGYKNIISRLLLNNQKEEYKTNSKKTFIYSIKLNFSKKFSLLDQIPIYELIKNNINYFSERKFELRRVLSIRKTQRRKGLSYTNIIRSRIKLTYV